MRKFNYITNKYEGTPDLIESILGNIIPEQTTVPLSNKKMNPVVEKYIKSKIQNSTNNNKPKENLDPKIQEALSFWDDKKYDKVSLAAKAGEDQGNPFLNSDVERQSAEDEYNNRTDGMGLLQFISGFGDALAQRSPSESSKTFDRIRSNIKDETIGAFDQRQKALEQQFDNKNKFFDRSIELEKIAREKDPKSPESLAAQSLAKQMMPNAPGLEKVTASQFKELFPIAAKALDIQMQREQMNIQNRMATMNQLDRAEERRENRQLKKDSKDAREFERQREKMTNYGEARTVEDAKKLKDASEMKDKFDRQLDELLELRKKHGGGALLNRDDVGRAKQLSKDLLLTYKDMSKLGVLSQSDNEILNAIIPPDPLAYDFVPGQDPILHKMEKFKGDTQSDFDTRLNNRLLNPAPKQQTNPIDSKIDNFMKKNGIKDRNEAIKILKENGKI